MAYYGEFTCKQDLINEFGYWEGYYDRQGEYGDMKYDDRLKEYLKECKILLAWYGMGDYEGSAFVLFEKDGELYEVNGSHCSCYGLEGQWDPEKTSVAELRHRITEGRLGQDGYFTGGVFDVPLKRILTRWENNHSA